MFAHRVYIIMWCCEVYNANHDSLRYIAVAVRQLYRLWRLYYYYRFLYMITRDWFLAEGSHLNRYFT